MYINFVKYYSKSEMKHQAEMKSEAEIKEKKEQSNQEYQNLIALGVFSLFTLTSSKSPSQMQTASRVYKYIAEKTFLRR